MENMYCIVFKHGRMLYVPAEVAEDISSEIAPIGKKEGFIKCFVGRGTPEEKFYTVNVGDIAFIRPFLNDKPNEGQFSGIGGKTRLPADDYDFMPKGANRG